MVNKGLLLVLSGPSGVGKGTIQKELRRRIKDIYYSVSATTRAPRKNETEGVDYFYISKSEFEDLIRTDSVLEYTEYCGNYYGTPKKEVDKMLSLGKIVLLEIETCGALQVIEKCKEAVSVFILPPSFEELRNRLTARSTEPPEVVESRLEKAKWEIEQSVKYQYRVINDTVENAVSSIIDIINENRKSEE